MMPEIILLRPGWLWALVPLAVYAVWLWRRGLGLGAWRRAVRPEMLRALETLGHVAEAPRRSLMLWVLLAVAMGIVALAGPAVERREAPSFRNTDAVIFVLDASASMTAHPDWAKLVDMGRFGLAAMGSRPGALIVFAGDAYMATDLTQDLRQLGQTLSLIDAGTVPDPGSRPERGLGLAVQVLRDAQVLTGDVILMTDGAAIGPEALALAETIRAGGARLSVVTPSPQPLLTQLAGETGTVFVTSEPETFTRFLRREARTVLERQTYPLLFWHDLGRYLLLLAALPLLLFFRRRPA